MPRIAHVHALAFVFCLAAVCALALPASAQEPYLVRDIETTGEPWYEPCVLAACPPPVAVYGSLVTPGAALGDRMIFIANDRLSGFEVWVSDGTEDGTMRLLDACPGVCDSAPVIEGAIGGYVLFWVADETTYALWRTDGTPEGTEKLAPGAGGPCDGGCVPYTGSLGFSFEGQRYFQFYSSEQEGFLLWRSDGTATGTEPVFEFTCEGSFCFNRGADFVEWQGDIFFNTYRSGYGLGQLWRLQPDGTVEPALPTCSSATKLTPLGDRLLFAGYCEVEGVSVFGLYETTGANHPVQLVQEFELGVTETEVLGGTAFVALNGPDGGQLWRSDGTPGGTGLVVEGPESLSLLTALQESLVFASREPDFGPVSLRSVGPGGLVKDLAGLPGTAYIPRLSTYRDHVVFAGEDEVHGRELWWSDGTPEGTEFLFDVAPGPDSSSPGFNGYEFTGFITAGDRLFFAAQHPDVDNELWAVELETRPPQAQDPSPADGVRDVALDTEFSWQVPRSGDWTYEVFLAPDGAPYGPAVCRGEAQTCRPSRHLLPETDYHWQVLVSDEWGGSTLSEIWSFTTEEITCPHAACLLNGRFGVDVSYRTAAGAEGVGQAVSYSEESALFWFFGAGNVEMVVKVLDACVAPYDAFWVFAAGLTDVGVTLTITDTFTGETRTYTDPVGTRFTTITDTAAFASCGAQNLRE